MVTRLTCPHCGQRCQLDLPRDEQPLTCSACGRLFLPNDQEGLPESVGRFRIRRILGAGAYGTVYLAEDPVLGRDVALKVLRSDASGGDKARLRFLGEAKAAAQLHHPNIIPVFDAGTDGHVDYLASEYIPGRTLEDELQDHKMDWDWAAHVCQRLADALAYAHRLGIVHRDVKSNNVMVDQHGDVHLTDFGLARRLQSDEKLTKDGTILGTAAYMAPEQASPGIGPVGYHSDQYSLGIILYELLCGDPPFSGPVAVVLYNCIHTEPPSPHTIAAEVPRDLEAICLKAISKRPEDRYPGCAEFSEDLRRWLAGEPLSACPIGPFERLGRWAERNPWIAGLAAAAAMLMLILAIVASPAWIRKMEVDRDLAGLARQKGDLLQEIATTENDIHKRETDLDDLAKQNSQIVDENTRIAGEIDDLQHELQRNVREKLNQFLEQVPTEWVFTAATGGRTRLPDEFTELPLATEAPALVIDPPWQGVSARGEAWEAQGEQPFGVGMLSIQFPRDGVRWRPDEPMRLSGRGDVVYYSVCSPHALPADDNQPHRFGSMDVYFLFRGSGSLALTLEMGLDCVIHTTLPVTQNPERHALQMDRWWARYVRSTGDPAAFASDPPSTVRSYLVRMLAHRLGKNLTAGDASHLLGPYDGYLRCYRDLLASESDDDMLLRLAELLPWQEAAVRHLQLEAWNSSTEFCPPWEAPENWELPSAEKRPRPRTPPLGADDLATHVPQECYYARFAKPEDAPQFVLGLGRLTGGLSLFDTASLSGTELAVRLLRQLALEAIIGGQGMTEGLISDIAVIGTDANFQDGAAVGVLVKAEDSELLGALIDLLRRSHPLASPDNGPAEITIGLHTVSLLQTEDQSIRSFHATSGDFHLISNSKYIVRRFLEAGQGTGSLAEDPQFQAAYRKFHADQQASLLLFVSESFWQHLLSPPWVIEAFRRSRARADLELVRLARQTAAAEGIPNHDIQDLIRARLLPESVRIRPDNSLPKMDGGILSDSLRGVPGTFVPIPDVVEKLGIGNRAVSAFEADLCRAHARTGSYATTAVDQLGPLAATISRPSREVLGSELVSLDIQFNFPLRELLARALEHPYLVQLLGPGRDLDDLLRLPNPARISPHPGDLAFVQFAFRTEAWLTFFGLREWDIPHRICNGRFEPNQPEAIHESASFYLGETATGGLLGRLTKGGYLPEDADGYATSVSDVSDPLRFRRWYGGDWVAFSPDRETLETVTQDRAADSGHPPAQIRIHLGNISESKLAVALRALAYLRVRRQSGATALLLEELRHQLHLTPSETLALAAEHYGGRSACPLGGDYTWNTRAWTGTAWSGQSFYDETEVPADYRLPLIDDLQGADISLQLAEDQITAHLDIHFKAN